MFHPSVRVAVHKKIEGDIQKELKWCIENIDAELKNELSGQYADMNPSRSQKCSLEDLYAKVKEILTGNQFRVLVMNGKNDVESSDYEVGCNFVVGGNTLGRGVTFPGLQTIYYTRTSKKPQADTMWQHSRMFGYDRDPGMMKVYIDENLYKLFADINATNNSIIAQVEKGIEDVKIYYPEGLIQHVKMYWIMTTWKLFQEEQIIIRLILIMILLKIYQNSWRHFLKQSRIIR